MIPEAEEQLELRQDACYLTYKELILEDGFAVRQGVFGRLLSYLYKELMLTALTAGRLPDVYYLSYKELIRHVMENTREEHFLLSYL